MLTNYFKIAFRNLMKRKGYFFLNVVGITIGMTCCLLIFHYVSYEKSYDEQIPNADNLYRLRLDHYNGGAIEWQSATVYPAIAPALKREFPEVNEVGRIIDANMLLVNESNDVKFNESKGYFAEPSVIHLLGIQLLKGLDNKALIGPNKMIISESIAKKYFGTVDVIGKTLVHRNQRSSRPYEITAVFKDFPRNSHLIIDFMASFDTFKTLVNRKGKDEDVTETLFDWYDFYSYIQLKPGADAIAFEKKLPAFCKKYMQSDMVNKTYDALQIIPARDIHLKSNYNQEAEINGNGQMVSFLFLIGLFIVFIAWINYVNLSTARSVERAKEVGVKKVLGAFRSDLIKQFLIENVLLNLIALFISLGLFYTLLNPFDSFTGRSVSTGISLSTYYWILFSGVFVIGTLVSGVYPALVLSGFKPIKVLKGVFKNSESGVGLRKSLIVIQFVISSVLIAGTIIVFQQVSFMRNKALGANINKTIVLKSAISLPDSVYASAMRPFKNELLQLNAIKGFAASSSVPGQEVYWVEDAKRMDATHKDALSIYVMTIDYDFVPLYSMKIVAGRNFSEKYSSDKNGAILINEKACELLGFKSPEEAINKYVSRTNDDSARVVGVLADYHHQGVQKAIDPMMFPLSANVRLYYSVKINSDDVSGTIGQMQSVWKSHFPNDPFDYSFLDESFNEQYKMDELFGKVFGVFSVLAIFIACTGLLGLSAYNVSQRSKEIGIRKVLGASVQNILLILSKDFVKLIVLALILAVPLGWFVMNVWLRDFAYRIDIKWWVFLLAGLVALLIAVITIVLQAYKSVNENPVKSLRTE